MRRLLLVLLLLALSVSSGAVHSGATGGSAATTDRVTSPPAVPPAASRPPRSVADLESLREEITRLIEGPGGGNGEWGVLAVSLEQGDTLMAVNPARPLAPASNQKILVTAAALHHLGPAYRFPTFLLTDGEIRDGVLHGDLILYGTGDPAISDRVLGSPTAAWRTFAEALRGAGVHTVEGGIVGDESFFAGPKRRPSWSSSYLNDWYAAPVSALTFAENVVTLRLTGGPPGAPARVYTEPVGADLPLVNTSVSVAGGGSRSLRIVRDDPDEPIEVRGQIGASAPDAWRVLTVSDPAAYAVSVLQHTLEEEGIRVTGRASVVRSRAASTLTRGSTMAPAFAGERTGGAALRTIAVHYSPPLEELIQVLNKRSHNLYAELLLFAVGRVVSGEGSFAGGSAALGKYLSDVAGVLAEDFHIEDGSGLSRLNRTTPRAFIRVLEHVAASEHAETFWASLPEAGNSRELRRMYSSPAAGNLRAKTGTIRRVSALSGIVRTADGEPVLFSILSNDLASSRAKRVEDAIGIELASFSRGVPVPRVGD